MNLFSNSNTPPYMSRRTIIYAVWGLVLGLIIWGIWFWSLDETIRSYANPEIIKQKIDSFGLFAPLVYIVFYLVAAIMFWSTTVLTILGGILFGGIWGSVYAIIAATFASQVAFIIARKLSGNKFKKLKTLQAVAPLIKKIESNAHRNGVMSIAVLRWCFVPYIALSYAGGTIPQLKGRDLFWGTLLSNLLLIPAFVYFGDFLINDPRTLFIPLIIILLFVGFPRLINHLRRAGLCFTTAPIPKTKK